MERNFDVKLNVVFPSVVIWVVTREKITEEYEISSGF